LDRISAKNPVVLLAAARYRETKHPLDRVKGIMQVFGLNIGNYLPGEPEPRLSDLEVELSQEIQQEMSYKFIVTHSLIERTRFSRL
jgi:hypothetical protein